MSTEIVLKLDIVVLLFSMFIHKHCLEVVTKEARVGRQVKLKMSKVKKEIKVHTHTHTYTRKTIFKEPKNIKLSSDHPKTNENTP